VGAISHPFCCPMISSHIDISHMNHSHMTNFLAVLPERFWLTCELIIYDEFACRSGVNGFCFARYESITCDEPVL
jgi:hypothetical protein